MLFLVKKKKKSQIPIIFLPKNRKSLGTLFLPKNRKAVSEMIGYILLITIGIAMSIIIFTWLKGYIPKESIECSEGVSVFIKNYN